MRLLLLIIIITNLFADYGGGYAGSGFRYSSNARDYALSGASIADKTIGFYAFSNPALYNFTNSNQIGISFQTLSLDRSVESYSFAKKLPPNAGIGLSILRSGTKNIQGRNTINEKTELFSAVETEGIISFGLGIGQKVAFGVNIKALFTSIYEDYKGNGIAADLGLIYKISRHLYFGFLFKNINAKYNWKVVLGEDEHSYSEDFPQYYSFGFASSMIRGISLYFQEDIIVSPSMDVNYRTRFGAEFKLKNKIKFRCGVKQSSYAIKSDMIIDEIKMKPSLGFGLPFKMWSKQYIHLDYALDLGFSNEGVSHLFSFSYQF